MHYIEDLRLLPVATLGMNDPMGVVRHLDSVCKEAHRLDSVHERKLAARATLKKSVLHRAFGGEL